MALRIRKLARFAFLVLFISNFSNAIQLPSHCQYGKECLIEVEGMLCADDTKSYITLVAKKNATHAMIFLNGGGACWSKKSCQSNFAKTLTRVEPNGDWENGEGIFNGKDPANMFRENYNIINVPYCTGDVFTGNHKSNYGSPAQPYKIHHNGYNNVVLAMKAAKELLGAPDRVVLLGQSAGGIGAYFHVSTLNKYFPYSKKFAISDAGTPFKPPYLTVDSYDYLLKSWGVDTTLPAAIEGQPAPTNFGELIEYNKKVFPDTKFGYIQAYADYIMTFFSYSLGAPDPYKAVRNIAVDVANNHLKNATNSKVYYIDDYHHTFTTYALGMTNSLNKRLDVWLNEMLEEKENWDNIRPDLHSRVHFNSDWLKMNMPTTFGELNNWLE